ncbi:restriction endonuclease subunit S, partial [Lactobacillus sp. XV13L]|nr:restriction endonuclease subunit S [Lactobacillus sp. XV13L]
MSEGKLVPRIRFQGFEDKWTKCKFVDILDPQNGIRRGPFGSSLRKDSFVNNSDYVVYEQQNAIYNKYETRYNISKTKFEKLKRFEILPGDFIMSGAGTIGKISEVPIGIKRGIFNQALIRFRINTGKTYRRYFLTFMRSNIMQKKLTEQNPGSAITNLVSMKEVKNYLIVIPIRKEQQKIGDLFAKLDRLLDLQQQKLDRLRLLKKALLQKLFPHRGAKIPELRFQGFEDEWKEEQLDEIVNRFDSQRIPVTASKRVPGTTPYYGANGIQDFVDGYTHQGEFILIAEDGADDLNDYPVRYVTGRIWV